jgi:salicylate hydroxylase
MGGNGLRVAVVGAGIAGLTLATALARAGIRVEVYEQARELREVGAGIQLSPNATRPLRQLGLAGHLDRVGTRLAAIEMRRWDTGVVLMSTPLHECEARFGAPYLAVHRADLHRGLRELIPQVPLHLGMRCLGVAGYADRAELRFDGGATTTADVVVGADGIRSAVRELLVADAPRYSGQDVYRGLVPGGRLAQVVAAAKVQIWLGPGQHCVYYPVAGGDLVSFVATTPAAGWTGESWTAPGRIGDVVAAYPDWHQEVRAVLAAGDTVTRWALHDRDPITRFSHQRVTLAGDAAHPMLPFGAQGANQAIEDAVALAACLRTAAAAAPDGRPEAVTAALQRYERARLPRTDRVHQTMRENARNHHYADGQEQRQRDRTMTRDWGLAGQEWLYGYDAERAVAS